MRKAPRKKPVKLHPTSVRLTSDMRDFLREEAEKRERLNNKFGTGDVSFMVSEILEMYKAHVTKVKPRKVA